MNIVNEVRIPVADLPNALRERVSDGRLVIYGGIRKTDKTFDILTAPSFKVLELDGLTAHTVKICISSEPPDTAKFKDKNSERWLEGWKSVFTAAGIIDPVVDSTRLITLLHSRDRIRFCCDTNALACGALSWAIEAFHQRADIVTSAVVDREIMAWSDRNRDMRKAESCKDWAMRTQFQLARCITEFPPKHVVIDRLAPDQSALMLAKLREEKGHPDESQNRKSPDADILLVELVRGIIRDMPRNSKILFLSGDRNLARTATNALGAESVLFMVSEKEKLKKYLDENAVATRGWWHPGDHTLGRVHIPCVSWVFWYLLCACDYLFIEDSEGKKWAITRAYSVPGGVPSDWTDPHIELIEIKNWLLPIRKHDGMLSEAPKGLRLPPGFVFDSLLQILFDKKPDDSKPPNDEVKKEIFKAFILLNIIDTEYQPSENFKKFRQYWSDNDLDGIHSEFFKLPGYCSAFDTLAKKDETFQSGMNKTEFTARPQTIIGLGQALGQLWLFNSLCFRGDNALSKDKFTEKLNTWLPNIGDALSIYELCLKASQELLVSPFRLERAMIEYFKNADDRFELGSGGTVSSTDSGKVVRLYPEGYEWIEIYPDGLRFGRTMPVRVITRVS
jgi:hypothetical protein